MTLISYLGNAIMASDPRLSLMAANLTPGEPVWGMALLFPPQGSWTESEYLELDAGRVVEFDQGCVEVHDMPTKAHQRIVRFLFAVLNQFVSATGLGEVFFAPLPVRLWAEKFREPDLLFIRHGRGEFRGYPESADLVIEVVSDGEVSRRRDLETKREEYFRAGIAEYWIVDPQTATITILSGLGGDAFADERVFGVGEVATSQVLEGFSVPVEEALAAAKRP
ncbi:MAG: Uma2 family endonuclease [Planctomycetota bacterium]